MTLKLTACLFVLVMLVLLPVTVWAQETTLTTKIPSIHILHIDVSGNGEVIVDGIFCKQTGDLQIKRGTTPQISVKPANGAVLKTAILEDKDITEELRKGAYKLPQMHFDTKLTVAFEALPSTPQTGDSVPVTALCLTLMLSFAGVCCCLVLPRENKI